jgi:methylated-DNA-[protein]-cysteine S-methyltransferase
MSDHSFASFETAIGYCALVWSARGIAGVQLPEANDGATRARLLRRFPAAREAVAPPTIRKAIDGIIALLRGEASDLSGIAIDSDGVPEFNARVYAVARTIPPAQTLSYGEIAERLGDRSLAREVGQALGQNPIPLIVACHRVLAAGGKPGGFSASGGVVTKLRLLTIEGAQPGGPMLFDRLPLVAPRRRRRG